MIKVGQMVKLKKGVGKETLALMGIRSEAEKCLRVLGQDGPGAVVTEIVANDLCRFNDVIVWIPKNYLEVVKK